MPAMMSDVSLGVKERQVVLEAVAYLVEASLQKAEVARLAATEAFKCSTARKRIPIVDSDKEEEEEKYEVVRPSSSLGLGFFFFPKHSSFFWRFYFFAEVKAESYAVENMWKWLIKAHIRLLSSLVAH
jgi:hypothetical protein